MKKLIYILLLTFSFNIYNAQAQVAVKDSVLTGAEYANEVYYSLKDGVLESNSITDWDLAVQIESLEGGIRTNDAKGVALYLASDVYEDFKVIGIKDTAGKISPAKRLYNSDTTWNYGSFNALKIIEDDSDYGWGRYDMVTHKISGDKIFFLVLANKSIKKARVLGFEKGTKEVHIEVANLDNTETEILKFDRDANADKNFVYYNFEDKKMLSPEPPRENWDLVFTRYYTKIQNTPYLVNGVLHNTIRTRANGRRRGAAVIERRNIPAENTTYDKAKFSNEINTIGSDWKNFDLQKNAWVIQDSLAYFVQDELGDIYHLVFTGFGGRSNGGYYFNKNRVFVGIDELKSSPFRVAPTLINSSEVLHIQVPENAPLTKIQIYNNQGAVVKNIAVSSVNSEYILPQSEFEGLTNGLYFLELSCGEKSWNHKIILNK